MTIERNLMIGAAGKNNAITWSPVAALPYNYRKGMVCSIDGTKFVACAHNDFFYWGVKC